MTVADPSRPDVVVARRVGDYNTFFPDLVRLLDGSLLAVYYRSRQHMHTPDSTIMLTRGSTDGRTWSEPTVLLDTPEMDDRDPSISQLRDGRLIVTWFRRNPADLHSADAQCLVIHSDDGGDTWSAESVVPSSLYRPATTVPPLEADDGRLLLPIYGHLAADDETFAARVAISHDRGVTWQLTDEVEVPMPAEEGIGLVEPTIDDLGDGRLFMVIRSRNHPQNPAYATWSTDAGASWSVPRMLDFPGHAPNLVRIADRSNRFLMTWGDYRTEESRERPVLGRIVDGTDPDLAGETFTLYENPGVFDMSYPSGVMIDEATALVIYYDAGAGVIGGTFVEVSEPIAG